MCCGWMDGWGGGGGCWQQPLRGFMECKVRVILFLGEQSACASLWPRYKALSSCVMDGWMDG
jgi:hypothetical protein